MNKYYDLATWGLRLGSVVVPMQLLSIAVLMIMMLTIVTVWMVSWVVMPPSSSPMRTSMIIRTFVRATRISLSSLLLDSLSSSEGLPLVLWVRHWWGWWRGRSSSCCCCRRGRRLWSQVTVSVLVALQVQVKYILLCVSAWGLKLHFIVFVIRELNWET